MHVEPPRLAQDEHIADHLGPRPARGENRVLDDRDYFVATLLGHFGIDPDKAVPRHARYRQR